VQKGSDMEKIIKQHFQPLENVGKPTVDTATAAFYLNRQPQTLRAWAMRQHPIRPINVNGRLAWPISEIKRLLCIDGGAK
jgi:hypothetical protein